VRSLERALSFPLVGILTRAHSFVDFVFTLAEYAADGWDSSRQGKKDFWSSTAAQKTYDI